MSTCLRVDCKRPLGHLDWEIKRLVWGTPLQSPKLPAVYVPRDHWRKQLAHEAAEIVHFDEVQTRGFGLDGVHFGGSASIGLLDLVEHCGGGESVKRAKLVSQES